MAIEGGYRRKRRRICTIRHQYALFSHLFTNRGGLCEFQIPAIVHVIRITIMGLLLLPAFDTNINTTIRAQKIITTDDDDVCGCSPPTYTFVLDFSLSCPPANITTGTGSGVASASCLISPFGAPTNKLAPVVVDSVSILELDQINSVLVEERIDGELFDGDSFSYSSIINNPDDITGIRQIPKALQLNLNGKNEDGIMLMNVFIVTFSNECGVFPVIQEGESAGWAIFSRMSEPIPGFCPTLAPSSSPSLFPTSDPSEAPTKKPTHQPSKQPTQEPSRRPTESPTPSPTEEPTSLPPTKQPIYNPIRRPTKSPTARPTDKPTPHPTSRRLTLEPSYAPGTKLPTGQTGLPTRSSLPISSDMPTMAFDNTMSMSMSMSLSISWDLKYSQLMEGELELMKEYLLNN